MNNALLRAELGRHIHALDKLYNELFEASYMGTQTELRSATAGVACARSHLQGVNAEVGKLLMAELTAEDRAQAAQAEVRS